MYMYMYMSFAICIVGVKAVETVLDNGQSEVRNESPVLWTTGVN